MFVVALLVAGAAARAQEPGPFWDRELEAMPGARTEDPESRLGAPFWYQPKARPFNVDFFESPELDARVRMDRARGFVVTALTRASPGQGGALLYRVRFESGEDAYIPVAGFEAELYVDPPPQSETRLKSDLYLSPEAYFFSVKSIFAEDPDQLWERIEHLGPSRIRPGPVPKSRDANPEGRAR
ncbi:MAG TPA: hypothetical protein VF104_06085 [Burkholderiales bacterium]